MMIEGNRRALLKGAAAAGVLAALPKQAARAQDAPKKGGLLRVGLAEGSTTDQLDPATYLDSFMMGIGFATHGSLTEVSPAGDLTGDLAERWEASDDAKIWRFFVRKGVEFQDGAPLRAEDVIASIDHHRGEDSSSAAKSVVENIESLAKIDDNIVEFTLKGPNADFPYLMADYHLIIMKAVDGKAQVEPFIGTGGYELIEFEPGVRARLRRHPNYWKDGRAHVDEVEMLVLADVQARSSALITGEVDVIQRCDLKTLDLLRRRPGVQILETSGYQHFTAPMITTASPFDDVDLRLALKYGVDRQELLDKILLGHGSLGNDTPIAPSVPFWADLEQRAYDPERAKHHLKKAGYENVAIPLHSSDAAYAGANDAAVLMQAQLAKAGIEVEVVREPADGYWSNVWMVKPWSQCYWGGRPTCDWMFSQGYEGGANLNDTFWANERFDELLVMGRAELNESVRAEIYGEMQAILRDDGGALVWGFANYVDGLGENVRHEKDVAANWALDGGRFAERWWLG